MLRVEFIYDSDCPNIRHARKALLSAYSEAGRQPSWQEWDRKSPDSPAYARQYGSPTVLVNGRDVAGAAPGEGSDSCRIYDHAPGGLGGVPPVQAIASALGADGTATVGYATQRGSGWWRSLASLPGVGAALLPVGVCPACWPVYAGILGSLGLGFLLESTYLLPMTVGFFGLALFALAFRAETRRGYGPLVLGIASAGSVLAFKFAYAVIPLVWAGLFGLVAASLWNAWPKKRRSRPGSCPKCVPQDSAVARRHRKGGADMATKRKIEVFSAGCPACSETVELVNRIACPSCEVSVLDMKDASVARRAKSLGIRSLPAVVIDGTLASCCAGPGPEEAALRDAGLGQPRS